MAPSSEGTTSQRTDLLAINLAWRIEGPPTLTISPCAVECKYVSGTYPTSRVEDALGQAEATSPGLFRNSSRWRNRKPGCTRGLRSATSSGSASGSLLHGGT